ncbi:MAG: SWIM zinc finger family protein [Clostridia bacterium]|nr:SWIM zinc finger family protein [Clostridia bacterium]
MGLIECTSGASLWRGYDYYKENKVKNLIETSPGLFTADVEGNSDELYIVEIDIEHPRKSKCNCPHADGKRIVCKHMMAVYFTAFPEEAQRIYNEVMTYQEQADKRAEDLYKKVRQCVWKMKKSEAQQALLEVLFYGPEWQLDRFVREHDLEDGYY